MKKRDPEAAKINAAAEKKEMEGLCNQIRFMTAKIPLSVLNGSYQKAVAYKELALKALKLCESKRPSLKSAREFAHQLRQFD